MDVEDPPPALHPAYFPKGLRNPEGYTCFANTAIQLLLSVEEFRDFFTSGSASNFCDENSLADHMYFLILAYINGDQEQIDEMLTAFLARCKDLASYLFTGQQQDCREFLTFVLNTLHAELINEDDTSIILELFELKEQRTSTCKNCSECILKDQTFLILDLPLDLVHPNSHLNVESLLLARKDDCDHTSWCDRCECDTDFQELNEIIRMPPVTTCFSNNSR